MAPIYLLYNNFVDNQYLNLKLNDYFRQSYSIESRLKVMKYLLFRKI